ncbi:MAG: hypothetical protein ABW198_04805 [Pseudorhodoplanes sp.]
MLRAGAILLLTSLALIGGCSDNEPALPASSQKLDTKTRFEFTLASARYVISLPEEAGMRDQVDAGKVTFDARKRQRLQKVLELASERPARWKSPDRQYRLRNGGIVNYHETADSGGGSGGAMATIEGELEIGLYTLFLYCSDQSEWTLYPDWCLEHLQTLELIPAPSGNG